MDIGENINHRLLTVAMLVCSHLLFIDTSLQNKSGKLEVIAKKQIGSFQVFKCLIDILQTDNQYEQDADIVDRIVNRTKQISKYMPDLIWVLINGLH